MRRESNSAVNPETQSQSSVMDSVSNQDTLVQAATLACNSRLSIKAIPQKRLRSQKSIKRAGNSNVCQNKSEKAKLFPIFVNKSTDQSSLEIDMSGVRFKSQKSCPTTQESERSLSDMLHDAMADTQESEDSSGVGGRLATDRHPVDRNPSGQSSGGTTPEDRNDKGGSGQGHIPPASHPGSDGLYQAGHLAAPDIHPEVDYLARLTSKLNGQVHQLERLVTKQKQTIKKLITKNDDLQKKKSRTRQMLKCRNIGTNTSTPTPSEKSPVQVATSNLCSVPENDVSVDSDEENGTDLNSLQARLNSLRDQKVDVKQNRKKPKKSKKKRAHTIDTIDISVSQSGQSDINFLPAASDSQTTSLPGNSGTHRRDTYPTPAAAPTAAPSAPAASTHRRETAPPSRSPGFNFPPPHPPPAGSRGDNAPSPPSYADYVRKNPKPTKIVFGSSLARGTAEALKHKGINVWEYYFSGAEMPYIRLHMERILEANPQVTQVVLLFGGNDCENSHHIYEIQHQYDLMIELIKNILGRDCCIIMCSIPQRRRCSIDTHLKIATLNKHLWGRHNPSENLHFLDAAPRFAYQFYDRLHMSYPGMRDWADMVALRINFIANFQAGQSRFNQ